MREADKTSRDSGVEPSELDVVLFTEVRRERPVERAGAGARVERAELADLVVVGGDVGLLWGGLREGGGVARDVI